MHAAHTRHTRFRFIGLIFAACAMALLLLPPARAAVQPDSVTAAWNRATAAGSYHFTAAITQITTPAATVKNVGRTSEEQTLHVDGQTDLPDRQTHLLLQTGGANV